MTGKRRKPLTQLASRHDRLAEHAGGQAATDNRDYRVPHAALIVTVLLVVAVSGCRTLSLIPHNHTCPHANPFFHMESVPFSTQFAAGKRQVPPPAPPLGPPPAAPYGPAPTPPPGPPSMTPQPPPHNLAPIASPNPPQIPPPVSVEDVVVERPRTVVETLIALRQEMQEVRSDNANLTQKLEAFEQQSQQRANLNQRTNILMNNVRGDLSTVQGELDEWRSNLSTLRGRVRDQHSHHEQTLVDVERQLQDMISLYETTTSESDSD